jgi:hypothetical protein
MKTKREPITIHIELDRDGTSACHVSHANPVEETWATTHVDKVMEQWRLARRLEESPAAT